MVRDAYANYVVQTTLDVISDGPEKVQLLQELNDHADQLVSLHNATLHNLDTFAQEFLVYNTEELHFREAYCDKIEHTMSSNTIILSYNMLICIILYIMLSHVLDKGIRDELWENNFVSMRTRHVEDVGR